MTRARPRVAVVGAGPSGLYAAAALAASDTAVDVDVLDRLPAPYGLVRYGVAPDHMKMKSVIRVLARPFGPGEVRFLGGVEVGTGPGQVPLPVLRAHYTAVVHASGCAVDRRLGIPGEALQDSIGSGDIVGWYCGHPDHGTPPRLDAPGVAVVGAGNVALDVARVLARTADELVSTDVPDAVLDALRSSAVRDVHVLIRRGPQQVKFTPVELRQLGDLADAEVVVHDDGLLEAGIPDDVTDRRERANMTALAEWAHARPVPATRRIHLRFLRSPVRILGEGHVTGIVVERNVLTPDGRVRGTGEEETLDVGLVVRAVGYTAEPIPGLPFDERDRHGAERRRPRDRRRRRTGGRAVRHRLDPARPDRRDRDQQARRRRGRRLGAGRPAHAAAPGPTGSGRPGAGVGRARRPAGRLDGVAAAGRRGDPPRAGTRGRAGQGRGAAGHAGRRARCCHRGRAGAVSSGLRPEE